MKSLILGAGVQGRVVADSLARRGAEVVLADIDRPAGGIALDASDEDRVQLVAREFDVAVTALPAAIGTVALRALIRSGIRVVDVSFTAELPLDLDAMAKEHGVPVLVDCGVAPGLSHVLVRESVTELDGADAVTVLVGGLPLKPPEPWLHAVYFHPNDLLAEYLRSAHLRRGGAMHAIDPLTETTHWDDDDVGTLEAFPSDGLRSLLRSFPDVATMEELTLRWPGHLDVMRAMKANGSFEPSEVETTARALERSYPGADHPDILVMEVHVRRGDDELASRVVVDRRDDVTAMSRATASTAAAGAVLLSEGFVAPGVHPPEDLTGDARERLLALLAEDEIVVAERTRKLEQRA